MDYKEFCDFFRESVLNNKDWAVEEENFLFFPDGYTAADGNKEDLEFIQSTNIKYHSVESDRLIGDYVVLLFDMDDESMGSCRFSMEYLFGEYNSQGLDYVWEIVRQNISMAKSMDVGEVTKRLNDYEASKDRLIIRPINYTDHKYELKNMIYRLYADIALVLYAILYNDKRGLGTVKISRDMFELWGKAEDDVWDAALANTNVIALPRMYMNAGDCFHPPYERGAFMAFNSDIKKIGKSQVPVVTTTKQVNGAIAFFYPGVKEKIAELFDGSYYIAFTSIDDFRVHHKDSVSPRKVLQSLKYINQQFEKEKILSRKVFYYDRDKKTFEALNL